ncbi:hypothetical protein GR247_40300 [Rhizobium leguminosarum]|nr:hypothetical protein [Rhizobium leguminosarum]
MPPGQKSGRLLWVPRGTPFIEVPDIAFRRRLAAYAARIIKAMLSPPSADGLVGNDDPEIEQHFLDIVQAQIKAKVEPDSTGYDFESDSGRSCSSVHSRKWVRCYLNFLTAQSM